MTGTPFVRTPLVVVLAAMAGVALAASLVVVVAAIRIDDLCDPARRPVDPACTGRESGSAGLTPVEDVEGGVYLAVSVCVGLMIALVCRAAIVWNYRVPKVAAASRVETYLPFGLLVATAPVALVGYGDGGVALGAGVLTMTWAVVFTYWGFSGSSPSRFSGTSEQPAGAA